MRRLQWLRWSRPCELFWERRLKEKEERGLTDPQCWLPEKILKPTAISEGTATEMRVSTLALIIEFERQWPLLWVTHTESWWTNNYFSQHSFSWLSRGLSHHQDYLIHCDVMQCHIIISDSGARRGRGAVACLHTYINNTSLTLRKWQEFYPLTNKAIVPELECGECKRSLFPLRNLQWTEYTQVLPLPPAVTTSVLITPSGVCWAPDPVYTHMH